MLEFKKWLLQMGGNVQFGDVSADRIRMNDFNRKKVVSEISKGLKAVSDRFQDKHGIPLWRDELFKTNEFLSGSSLHLFNLKDISDEEFKKHKATVGDIDTQVDGEMKSQIDSFLKSISIGEKIGNIIFQGSKPSGDQFITLWNIPSLGLNVQVDLELVGYSNGKPTPWSTFSHSSAWEDIKSGVKGVFQKYILRSLNSRSAKDVLIQAKTSRGKDKILHTSELAFSLRGLRTKLSPVLDINGKQLVKDGKLVYKEIDTEDSFFETDLDILFKVFFGIKGTPNEIEQFKSFVGILALAKKYFNKNDLKKILNGFANLLWGSDAQSLVRGGPQEDFDTKKIPFDLMLSTFEVGKIEDYQAIIDSFYKEYK